MEADLGLSHSQMCLGSHACESGFRIYLNWTPAAVSEDRTLPVPLSPAKITLLAVF
jgi:hypothetical protein